MSKVSATRPARSKRPTPREAAFLRAYLAGPPGVRYNGTQAVLTAGLTASPNSAHVIGHRLLRSVTVQRTIAAHVESAHSTAEKALARTALRAYADPRDVATWDADGTVSLIPSDQISEAGAAAIAGLTQRVAIVRDKEGRETETRRLEVKFHDGDGARRDLLKVHKLLRDGVDSAMSLPIPAAQVVVYVIPDNGRALTSPAESARRIGASPARPIIALPTNGRNGGSG